MNRRDNPARRSGLRILSGLLLGGLGCNAGEAGREGAETGPLVVFTAGSLSRPMRAALDSFSRRDLTTYELESAGSLETARKLTELGKIPDLIALADEDVFPKLLVPAFTSWYVRFAQNRIVIAYTDRSRHAAEINAGNWWRVLRRTDVEVGRSNPELDPAGYRTLMVFQLAERRYAEPGLAAALERQATARNMRPKEIELVALLEAGELDYAWFYESMARAAKVRYVRLPDDLDLSTEAFAAEYANATVRVPGATVRDTVTMRGAPIRYAFSIPDSASHRALGERFAVFLLSQAGRAALESEYLATLPTGEPVGQGLPELVLSALRPSPPPSPGGSR